MVPRDESKSASSIFADPRPSDLWPIPLFVALWLLFCLRSGFAVSTAVFGIVVVSILGFVIVVIMGAGGQRQRQRQLKEWIRARKVPNDVPERVWRPGLERYRDGLTAAWVFAFIAVIQVASVVFPTHQPGSAAWWGDALFATLWVATAVWALVRLFRDRPIVRDLIEATSQQYWRAYHRENSDGPPSQDL